jgi:hypothetical protein
MRLLDRVSHSCEPVLLALDRKTSTQFNVTGPSQFASRIAECPLRFVLGDDLTRASAELAFADGARLGGCLDLLRMPAPRLWIEWNDAVYKRVIHETHSAADFDMAAAGRRVGVLIEAATDGLSATARTFWVDAADDDASDVIMSPLETHIDLRGQFAEAASGADLLGGGFARVTDRGDAAMASILDHVRFRIDETWGAYYRAAATTAESRRRVVHDSLAAIARDTPFLLAFILLLTAKDATRTIPVSRDTINRKRLALGRSPLLDHVEVHASLDALDLAEPNGLDVLGRQSPRLHHVRGHLVRRDHRIFWRVPHLRGSACRGFVRSRTVCLSFARRLRADPTGTLGCEPAEE